MTSKRKECPCRRRHLWPSGKVGSAWAASKRKDLERRTNIELCAILGMRWDNATALALCAKKEGGSKTRPYKVNLKMKSAGLLQRTAESGSDVRFGRGLG